MDLSDGRKQLTNELEQEGMTAMKKIGAFIGSNGDPAVMNSFKDPPSTFVLILISSALIVIMYIIAAISNYYEIQKNWSTYRCRPEVTPFAKFYGYDLNETMNFCIAESVKAHAPGVIDPIYQGVNAITGTVDGVYKQVVGIGAGIGSLLKGFNDFVLNFINSFRLLGTRVRMSVIRLKDIFGRIYGTFIAFAYAGISAITFGENLVCNPLVVFLGTISGVDVCCFAPETRIRMADGSAKQISAIVIGDRLAAGATVCSTYRFDGSQTAMVRINGVHVSTNHYLQGRKTDKHPDAVPAEQLSRLWCLGTSNNLIPIITTMGDVNYADYEESSDPAVISEAQRIAERALNAIQGPTVPDYSLGLDPTLLVLMKHGVWKPLQHINIGDVLVNGSHVTGVIEEVCPQQCRTPGGHYVSAAQLVHHEGRWVRAANIWPTLELNSILYHLMTSLGDSITVGGDGEVFNVRDYAEIPSMDIQAPYDKKMNDAAARVEHVRC